MFFKINESNMNLENVRSEKSVVSDETKTELVIKDVQLWKFREEAKEFKEKEQ